jgi:ABC-type Na+ efflux pump permease subunit
MVVAMSFWWWWDISIKVNPFYEYAHWLMALGSLVLVGMALAMALVLTPAVMAGSLAGEKERGSLGLFLTTRVNALEIVSGRLAGKLSQVGMILLAALPGLVLLGSLAGFHLPALVMMLALPAAVAFGSGGLAAAASSLCRRGRDALLAIYLIDVLFLLAPLLGRASTLSMIGPLSPFSPLPALTWDEQLGPAWSTTTIWVVIGLLGIAVASWRLRPACLQLLGNEVGRRGRRRKLVPALRERPMLWKEFYIDRVGTLGRAGRWIGSFIVLLLVGAGLAIAVSMGLGSNPESGMVGWSGRIGSWITDSAIFLSWLIQCAIGLRAAATISSERERGTWDALLTSPLEGGEIIRAKLSGSLYALRWLIFASFWAWCMAWVSGELSSSTLFFLVSSSLIVGAFMAAVGVRSSLATHTATRSMSITMGIWLAAMAASSALAAVFALILVLLLFLGCILAAQAGLVDGSKAMRVALGSWGIVWVVLYHAFYVIATFMITSEARLRFDRIAGRMTGGEIAVAVDQMLHGRPLTPLDPIDIGSTPAKPEASNGAPLDDELDRCTEKAPEPV